MKFRHIIAIIIMSITTISGFGAMPSKPDFAYPKTVKANAEKELKNALKSKDDPAAVRALIDYALAQAQITPDKTDDIAAYFDKISEKLNSPAAKGIVMLVKGQMLRNDTIIDDAIHQYYSDFKNTPTSDWSNVIDADILFFPTVYDFAVELCDNDSIRNAAIAYDSDRPYPLIYREMANADDFEEYKQLFLKHQGEPTDIYPMQGMVNAAYNVTERKEAYELLNGRTDDKSLQALKTLLRPEIQCSANEITALGRPVKIRISAVCLHDAKLKVVMEKPIAKSIKTIDLKFKGEGVFVADTMVEITLNEYGVYNLTPTFEGADLKRINKQDVIVTDFQLARSAYGNNKSTNMALDNINGALQKDVKITRIKSQLYGSRGNDLFSPKLYCYEGYDNTNETNSRANILTDRAIYHPGDTLRFVATLMQSKGVKREILSGKNVKVELNNTNWKTIASQSFTSDDYGRITGEFQLPKEGLTGRYSLQIDNFGTQYVMVTDYKAPTFEVELKAERIDSTTVELRGKAVGYNGFPIIDAQVAIAINELPEWIWFRSFRNYRDNEVVATDTLRTDANGMFSTKLSVPAGLNLSATATFTSLTGESHDDSAFIPYNRYFIDGNVAEFTEANKGPVFRVLNAEGNPANVTATVLLNDSITPDKTWSNVPSGKYKVKVTAPDAASREYNTVVYRRNDAMSPIESALFVPFTSAKPGDKLLAGTSFDDSHILMTVWTPDSLIEQKWITPKAGNFLIDIQLPNKIDDAVMTLATMRNYKFYEKSIKISRPNAVRSLRLDISSMRDKMTPGESEIWTVRVTDNLGKPIRAAVMADAYCKALDALQPFNWAFNTPYIFGKSLRLNAVSSNRQVTSNDIPLNYTSPFLNITANFNTWGEHWPVPFMGYYSAGVRNYALMSKAMATDGMEMEDAIVEATTESSADTGSVEENNNDTTDDTYRMPEIAVALWQPVLTTDADGSLQIKFTAPDANTTWSVKALAYDKRLMSGIASAEIVTSKPVMVQPQWPRFMRVGDVMELRASVMNNSDSAALVSSVIELFDTNTGNILICKEFADRIEAMSSTVISTEITAPEKSFIGVRIKSTAGNFTDGEQNLIAILPNQVDVRTGTPIFLPSDSTESEVSVPRGGVMTLTANAVWECVSALPGLMVSESESALSAAAAMFSAATARGLMRQHPEIGRALHSWEQEDSFLISNLRKNDDLKIALLESTPFVSAAQSESDQRARLLLLFNNKEIDNTISSAVTTLSKLTRKGGLAWTQNCNEPSPWITRQVLFTIAQLRRLGYPVESKELNKIVTDAVTYLDKEVASEYAKNKKSIFMDYVMLRSRFPEVRQSAPAKRAADATIQYVVAHWKEFSLPEIAKAAIILNENNYPTTARSLIESLRQHEAWAQMPLSPTLLEAFAGIEPHCPEVEQIRNEYVSRKQSMDWGSGMQVSNLVASILNSGAEWLVPAANQLSIKVNGEFATPNMDNVSGALRLDLPEGGKVEIAKGDYPAWGGVFSASVNSIQTVEPFSSKQLKLTRTIEGKMKVGEKITVKLTLEASQDIDYVVVRQPHCAGMEVVNQKPSTLWLGRLNAYREPTATCTNWFFNRLAEGKTEISEVFYVTAEGNFILAPAEAQSQYAPEFQSHTAGAEITTKYIK